MKAFCSIYLLQVIKLKINVDYRSKSRSHRQKKKKMQVIDQKISLSTKSAYQQPKKCKLSTLKSQP